jgi:hypothetical protein
LAADHSASRFSATKWPPARAPALYQLLMTLTALLKA